MLRFYTKSIAQAGLPGQKNRSPRFGQNRGDSEGLQRLFCNFSAVSGVSGRSLRYFFQEHQVAGAAVRQGKGAGLPCPAAQPPQRKADKTPPKQEAPKKTEKTLQETVDWVLTWVRTGGQILRRLLEGFKIHHIRIYLPVHRENAASTALAVGAVHAGLGASFGMLQNFLDLRMEQLVIEPDYTGEHQGQEHFSCKITSHLIIMVITGVWALLRLRKEKLI